MQATRLAATPESPTAEVRTECASVTSPVSVLETAVMISTHYALVVSQAHVQLLDTGAVV